MKLGLLLCALVASACADVPPREFKGPKPGDTPANRARALLAQMTQAEKLSMVYGHGGAYVGDVPAISRLGIPAMTLEDGPSGVADGVTGVTAWPSALTVVATWQTDLMEQFGAGMGYEQRVKGTNIMLGPMVNLARVPYDGRNFESFGEDPHLASRMAFHSVTGIQSQGVIATVKHWVNNNQETHRTTQSANVDMRSEFELYYPAFQGAIDAGVGSVMCSYNKINNTWACENPQTLGDLKNRLGFTGWVMSDWGATHSTVPAALAGLDQQMPDNSYFGQPLATAIANGQVPQSRLDDMVYRMLLPLYAVGVIDNPNAYGNMKNNATSPAHNQLARKLATAATVLLKNDGGILPLDPTKPLKIAVIGDDAHDNPIATGWGSGGVKLPYLVTPLDGITARATNAKITYTNSKDLNAAAAAARAADVAIVFAGVASGEGTDRTTLALPGNADQLFATVAAAQPKTVGVVHAPGAVLMPWASTLPSIVCAFLPGQEDGNAIAEVLFGDVNPSARLPVSFPVSDSIHWVNSTAQWPGTNDGEQTYYSEKLLVGYRWYDAVNLNPLWPFGHGLSYTSFSYSDLWISGSAAANVTVSVNVANVGSLAGTEIVQLYLGFPSSSGEPPQVLRGFKDVYLNPGDASTVVFELYPNDFSIWDIVQDNWALQSGTFQIRVGASSRDIRITGTLTQ